MLQDRHFKTRGGKPEGRKLPDGLQPGVLELNRYFEC